VDAVGGMIRAIESGWVQREIHGEAYRQAIAREQGTRVVVGVNKFRDDSAPPAMSLHRADPALARRQIARLQEVRRSRDQAKVSATLEALREGAVGKENLVPRLLDAVRAYASVGEIAGVLRETWGMFREPATV